LLLKPLVFSDNKLALLQLPELLPGSLNLVLDTFEALLDQSGLLELAFTRKLLFLSFQLGHLRLQLQDLTLQEYLLDLEVSERVLLPFYLLLLLLELLPHGLQPAAQCGLSAERLLLEITVKPQLHFCQKSLLALQFVLKAISALFQSLRVSSHLLPIVV
jgi:hypothetical protein